LRLLTTVESSSDSLTTSTSFQYTNCAGEPFSGTVTLDDINNDITTLRGTLDDCTTGSDDVSVVSFPCITDVPSLSVFFNDQNALFPSLQKIRFANLVTVDGFTIQNLPALISISAPLLQKSASSFTINGNNLLPKIDFPSLSEVEGRVFVRVTLFCLFIPGFCLTFYNNKSYHSLACM